jgi:hypothetical protein
MSKLSAHSPAHPLKSSKANAMSQSLLVYKDGKFSTADPVPDWYANMLQDTETDWDAVITRAGFRELGRFELGSDVEGTSVYVNDEKDIFYAECFVCGEAIWAATFCREELPSFFAKFVLPIRQEHRVTNCLDLIYNEIVEYLVRNEPNNPERATREEARARILHKRAQSRTPS